MMCKCLLLVEHNVVIPGKIGHLRPVSICWYGSWFEISWFICDTMRHLFFFLFLIVLHLQWFDPIIDLHFIFFSVWWDSPSVFLSMSLSLRICGALQSPAGQLVQVDVNGNALLAGYTSSSLDGNANKGNQDIFLMKFDAHGVHLWTRQHSGEGFDYAYALEADGVLLRFRRISMEEKLQISFRGHVQVHMEWHHHSNGSICWVPLQGWSLVFVGSLTDVFWHL